MINDELNTPFRWYNDIDKQNRYKGHCAANCDYKLISRNDNLLPFQIRGETGEDSPIVYSWTIHCAEDDAFYMSLDKDLLTVVSLVNGYYYIIFSPDDPLTQLLECGSYYSQIVTSDNITFTSEVFTVVDFEDNSIEPSLAQIPIFTAWRWYDNIEKQNRYRSNCAASCDYYLITPQNSLLPFQFRIPTGSPGTVEFFKLIAVDGSCEHYIDPSVIQKFTTSVGDYDGSGVIDINDLFAFLSDGGIVYDYFYYNGDPISDLPCGRFYGVITIDGVDYYSELIETADISNPINEPGNYILQETGFKILQETGFGLLTE